MSKVLVKTLDQLAELAELRRAVTISANGWHGRQGYIPASRVLCFQGAVLHRLMLNDCISVYQPKSKPEEHTHEV